MIVTQVLGHVVVVVAHRPCSRLPVATQGLCGCVGTIGHTDALGHVVVARAGSPLGAVWLSLLSLHQGSHTHTGEPRKGIMSRVQIPPGKPLMDW